MFMQHLWRMPPATADRQRKALSSGSIGSLAGGMPVCALLVRLKAA